MTVTIGLEQLLDHPDAWLQPGDRIGLLSNPTGVDRRLRSAIDLLHRHPDIQLTRLFGPEHGIRGDAQAGVAIGDGIDARTEIPVTSLYSHDRSVAENAFADIDVLLIDLQDIGTRYYTYIATANSAARRATAAGVRVLVLDRPNPIAWMGAFGNRVGAGCGSIVGLEGLPIAHGCTIGEILIHLARQDGRTPPEVVPMDGWDRGMRWQETGLPWVPPSPNLPTLDTAHLYPATCLIEGTSLSEGRGTARPFEQIGDPAIDAYRFAEDLETAGPAGYLFRPTTFVPTFSKHESQPCHGVQIHADGDHDPAIMAFGPTLLEQARKYAGDSFSWVTFNGVAFIDRLAGGSELRETIDAGGDIGAMLDRWSEETAAFVREIDPGLIYGPLAIAPTGVAR